MTHPTPARLPVLPPSEAPPVRAALPDSRFPQAGMARPPAKSSAGRHMRGPDRQRIAEYLAAHAGRVVSIRDIALGASVDHETCSDQVAYMARGREWPELRRVGMGCYVWTTPSVTPSVPPAADAEAPALATEVITVTPSELIMLAVVRTLPTGELLAMDEDTGRAYVLRPARAGDL